MLLGEEALLMVYKEEKKKIPSLKKYPNLDTWRSVTEDQ